MLTTTQSLTKTKMKRKEKLQLLSKAINGKELLIILNSLK